MRGVRLSRKLQRNCQSASSHRPSGSDIQGAVQALEGSGAPPVLNYAAFLHGAPFCSLEKYRDLGPLGIQAPDHQVRARAPALQIHVNMILVTIYLGLDNAFPGGQSHTSHIHTAAAASGTRNESDLVFRVLDANKQTNLLGLGTLLLLAQDSVVPTLVSCWASVLAAWIRAPASQLRTTPSRRRCEALG